MYTIEHFFGLLVRLFLFIWGVNMNKKAFLVPFGTLLLAGCMANTVQKNQETAVSENVMPVTSTNLKHHNWELISIDGKPFKLPHDFSAPNLEIGESFTANGQLGCNRYFGQGELKGQQFRIDKMASTMMACPPEANEVEKIMSAVLGEWSTVTLTKQSLELKTSSHSLQFKLKDWVN